MTLYSACAQKHTLVNVVNDLWACECPAVYRRISAKIFVDPQLRDLLGQVQRIADRRGGLQYLAKGLEQEEEARKLAAKKQRRTKVAA